MHAHDVHRLLTWQMLRESSVATAVELTPSVLSTVGGEESRTSMDSIDADQADACLGGAPTSSCSDEQEDRSSGAGGQVCILWNSLGYVMLPQCFEGTTQGAQLLREAENVCEAFGSNILRGSFIA